MAQTSVLHWLSRHGVASLYDIVELLDRGATKQEVAKKYGIDNGQFSRFLKDILETHFVLKKEVAEFIRNYMDVKEEKMERHEQKRAAIIQLTNAQTRNANQKAAEKS